MISLLRTLLPVFFTFIASLPISGYVFAEPPHQDDNTSVTTVDSKTQHEQNKPVQPENPATPQKPELPKGFKASADQVLQDIDTNFGTLIESCGNAGLTTLGFEIDFDAKGNIFEVSFTYSVKNDRGHLAGTEDFVDDVSSLRSCIGKKLYKHKFNIDVTDDVIELFSQKDNKVITKLWYGSYRFSYRYDENRIAGLTTYNIGNEAETAQNWRCRKHGCKHKFTDKFVSNKEIESMKAEIIELMHKLPVDRQTMMAPEDKLYSE